MKALKSEILVEEAFRELEQQINEGLFVCLRD